MSQKLIIAVYKKWVRIFWGFSLLVSKKLVSSCFKWLVKKRLPRIVRTIWKTLHERNHNCYNNSYK